MRALIAWSGGKDSAWALHVLRRRPDVEVTALFATVDESSGRVPIHAVPRELMRAQAAAAKLPLHFVPLPWPCPNAEYEARLGAFLSSQKAQGITHVAFGDLFLEDIQRYRERQLAALDLAALFPLWGLDTAQLARGMTGAGLRAWITAVDASRAPREWAGRCFDAQFVEAVPPGVDPCGENGEFHTFVFEGPMLHAPVACRRGRIYEAGSFVHAELLGE